MANIINLFGIKETVKEIYESRGKNAQIPVGAVFLSLFFGMLALCKSLRSMERFRKMGKLFSSFGMRVKSFSEDTVSDVLSVMAIEPLKNGFIGIVKKLRKNKIFESAKYNGFLAVAIDLNQYARLFRKPKDHKEWHYTKASENTREYYSQKGVFAQVMNSIKPFFIGFMRCAPGEGELTIAKKLIPKSINGMKPSKKQKKRVYILTTIPVNQMSAEDIMFFQKQ